ncbi:unnamed protein product [Effrenium voratum]|nr:unnamed protein product [Effrenium voratum]
MLAWPADNDAKAERSPARTSAMKVIKTATKRSAMKAMQSSKPKGCLPKGVSLSSVLIKTSKVAKNPNINLRTRKVNGLRVEQAMAEVKWRSPGGVMKVYGISDVKYDLLCGYTKIRTQAK